MKYGQYIKEHKVWIIIFSCLLCSVEIFLLTMKGSEWLMIYVALALLIGFFLGTYADYYRWEKYFRKAQEQLKELDKKYLLCELLEKGAFQEEKILKDIFYEMEVSMNEQVAGYVKNSREYKEYVETWVHEIKLPIAAIKMILANHQEADLGIEDEVNRMEGYVEQALFYARSNDVEKDYLINRVNLKQVVEAVVLKNRKVLRGMNARIHMHQMDTEVNSDSKWLAFMVGQVIDNSIKYGKKGELAIEIYSEKRDNAILLHICDNGEGIKASELSKVFQKGFTGSNGRKNANSTGIGLYLCKKLCERLEHNITIDSKEGEGTRVTFIFPLSGMMTLE